MAFGSFLDKAKKAAEDAAKKAQKEAQRLVDENKGEVLEKAQNLMNEAGELRSNINVAGARKALEDIGDIVQSGAALARETFMGAKESTLAFVDLKLREMVRGLNLQETIDAVNKAGKEKHVDVTPLTKFIEQLKQFGDNGNQE